MWDRTGVLEKSGENVASGVRRETEKDERLGRAKPDRDPRQPHRRAAPAVCFPGEERYAGDAQFLNRSGHANNHSLWLIAQAVSEILPDGDKEKQLMQGLLNQKEGLVEATRQGTLF